MTSIACCACGAPLPPRAAQVPTACPYCGATNAPPPRVVEVERIVVATPRAATGGTLCPRCAEPLRDKAVGETRLRGCERCGGLWLDTATVERLRRVRDTDVEDAARRMIGGLLRRIDVAQRVSCPECGAAMERHVVPDTVHDIDVCGAHGTWFDYQELSMFIRTFAEQRAGDVTAEDLEAAGVPGGGLPADDGGFFTDLFHSLRRLASQ